MAHGLEVLNTNLEAAGQAVNGLVNNMQGMADVMQTVMMRYELQALQSHAALAVRVGRVRGWGKVCLVPNLSSVSRSIPVHHFHPSRRQVGMAFMWASLLTCSFLWGRLNDIRRSAFHN